MNLKRMTEALLRVGKISLPPVDVAQIQERNGIAGPQQKRLLEILNRIFRVSFLRGHHAKIVPRFRVVGTQLQSLFKIRARSGKVISPQAERTQVVVGVRIVRLAGDDLKKRLLGLLQIAVLEQYHSVRKFVAQERALVELSFEWDRFSYAIG